jgi:2-iminobutanoate/2-iminopropanoate deaminase
MVEISAIAARDGTAIEAVTPDGWPSPSLPYSHAMRAGNTLFLSALRPADPASGRLAGTTIEAQTEQALNNQESILRAAGLSFADLVYSRIYLADPGDYDGLNKVYRQFVTAVPPARATVNPRLDDAVHLIQIQSTAVKGSGEGRPPGEGFTSPIHSYSVKSGTTLYITGMTGRRPDATFASGDIRAQTRQALATIEEQLRKHGMTFADIVDSTVWLRDSRDFAGMNEVYREIVQPNPPARATVRIPPNSGKMLVEIMMVAEK